VAALPHQIRKHGVKIVSLSNLVVIVSLIRLTLLSSIKEGSVLGGISDLDDLGSGEKLHNETRGNDGRDSQLHQGSSVRGQDNTDPVEGIGRVRAHDSK